MNISICITTFNEEGSIASLLDSLLAQTKKPKEVVIVDGGSTDKTLEIISHYQKKSGIIKLLKEKCSRSKGRNLGIDAAKSEVIAITDAGCVAKSNWLEEISAPFKNPEVDIVAGFYKMVGSSDMQTAMGVFLGVTPRKFGINFLPSTRSMAFRKSAWEKVGGFPESRENSAEDTDFNYLAVRLGLKYARVKTALVEWGMPANLKEFYYKVKEYALWDARRNIWWHPTQRLASHNIKALSVFARYVFIIFLAVASLKFAYLSPVFIFLLLLYLFWAYRKVWITFGEYKKAVWGPVLQIVSDIGVIAGFVSGILGR